MLPNSATSTPTQYGIVKDPIVIDFIRGVPVHLRDEINNAIDTLQFNPRPLGHEPVVSGSFSAVKFVVGQSYPQYILVCSVDDEKEKVYVIAIVEKRFSSTGQHISKLGSRSELLDLLDQFFNEDELRELCFDLNIDYEGLYGNAKRSKIRELISYCERHKRATELRDACMRLRPKVDWSRFEGTLSD